MNIAEEVVEAETVPLKEDLQNEKQSIEIDFKLTVETEPYIHPLIGMDGVSPYDYLDE